MHAMNTDNSLLPLRFLAISGSLRAASSNTVLLRAAAALAPPHVFVEIYENLGEVPHFNPDLDGETAPFAVADLRARLRAADAVIICSPEYAHGVPGTLKNALDWIVRSGEFMDKPVALLNASPVSTRAHDSLAETLSVMMAQVMPMDVPLSSNKITQEDVLSNAKTSAVLRQVLEVLVEVNTSPTN
jgi:chromate reductase